MKAYLEFELPEDQDQFKQYSKAPELVFALFDIKEELRKLWKYKYVDSNNLIEQKIAEECYDLVNDILDHNNINLDDLIY